MSRFLLFTLLLLSSYTNGKRTKTIRPQKPLKKDQDGTYGLCENEFGQMYYYKEYEGQENVCEKDIAKVKYSNRINETGWAFVEVEVSGRVTEPFQQGYAAGFVEGRATRELIQLHISNTVDGFCEGAEKFCEDLNQYLLDNFLWMEEEIAKNPNSHYWIQVNMTINQLLGMIDGYEGNLGRRLSLKDIVSHPLFLIQLAGDIEDLAVKFKKPETQRSLLAGTGHCSALVKILPDHSDIYFSHVTWASYSSMLRMQKRYTFATHDPGRRSIASIDDFIVTSAGLGILETTISNYNEDLMQYMTPQSVLCWIRTQVAHRTSSSGLHWAKTFAKHNSGTYNNQWSILDYKKFHRDHRDKLLHGLLHVLEQLPNHIVHTDMTHTLLRQKYWPSYNTPYFPKIFEWSESGRMVKKYGDWFSYEKTPRALIFRRDHDDVTDMNSMIRLMRSNNYTEDPLSRCECDPPYSGENAISCRSDLNPPNGTYPFPSLGHRDHGATDMKVTNSHLIESLSFTATAGPTHGPTPVFDWNRAPFKDIVPHNGHPTQWTFKPITHQWESSLYTNNQQDLK
ncbi:lysophospholipase [Necator americanus]|uniref:Phospholipase B-like n=1 Tax=Necator americanus TaxID=51031 RepID=W2SR05_NECAM|nr:lysophospholipase [Necator americanus]ETN71256.1 lysophospholipase [Necator americanus]